MHTATTSLKGQQSTASPKRPYNPIFGPGNSENKSAGSERLEGVLWRHLPSGTYSSLTCEVLSDLPGAGVPPRGGVQGVLVCDVGHQLLQSQKWREGRPTYRTAWPQHLRSRRSASLTHDHGQAMCGAGDDP